MASKPERPEGHVKVSTVTCLKCNQTIYSRAQHDFRWCKCNSVCVDGGLDYFKMGAADIGMINFGSMPVAATRKQLYDDWNSNKNKFGVIEGGS